MATNIRGRNYLKLLDYSSKRSEERRVGKSVA